MMAKSLNEKLQDIVLKMQGKRTLQSNWLAVKVDDLYLDAWNKCFSGDTAKASAFRGITDKAVRLVFAGNDSMFKTSWMETWKEITDAMPKALVTAVSSFKVLSEDEEEDNVNDLPETAAQASKALPTGASLPTRVQKGYKFAEALYNPPSQKEISLLNLKSEWRVFLEKETHEAEIIEQITAGVSKGQTNRQVARNIQRLVRNDKTAATRTARTEMHRVNVAAQESSVRSALGKSVGSWKYLATLDTRTRPHHAAQDGNVYADNVSRPLLPDGPNCRCTYTPVTKAFDELKDQIPELEGLFGSSERASMSGLVPADEKYSTWFGKQSVTTQKDILGKGNFKRLSKNGSKVKWSSFVSSKKSPARKPFAGSIKGNRGIKTNVKTTAKTFKPAKL